MILIYFVTLVISELIKKIMMLMRKLEKSWTLHGVGIVSRFCSRWVRLQGDGCVPDPEVGVGGNASSNDPETTGYS